MRQAIRLLEKIYSDSSFADQFSPTLFPTSISQEQGQLLAQAVEDWKPQTVLELGFGYGISSLWIQSSKHNIKKHIIVDPQRIVPQRDDIYQLLKQQQHIIFEEKRTSQQFLAEFQYTKQQADLIFIDADEKFDGVMADMYFAMSVLSDDGRVIMRNIWNPSVRKALLFYIRNMPIEVTNLSPDENDFLKKSPIFTDEYLKRKFVHSDLCMMRLTAKDTRAWNHYVSF